MGVHRHGHVLSPWDKLVRQTSIVWEPTRWVVPRGAVSRASFLMIFYRLIESQESMRSILQRLDGSRHLEDYHGVA